MRLQEIFRPDAVLVGFEARDKWDAIERLVEHAARSGRFDQDLVNDFREAVVARERSMSTGMEHGLAIPHAALDGIEEVVACLAVAGGEQGIQFESIDGSPTHLIVLLLIPRAQKLLHIRTLANIARVLGREDVRRALLHAPSPTEAWEALAEGAEAS